MTHVYRIFQESDVGQIVGSIELLEAFARDHDPSRYDVYEHCLDPFPGTTVSSKARGEASYQRDGHTVLDPIP
jgi:hypothetical protein